MKKRRRRKIDRPLLKTRKTKSFKNKNLKIRANKLQKKEKIAKNLFSESNSNSSQKKQEKENKRNSLNIFLLILAIIIGSVISYLFQNIYVYSVSVIIIIYLILIIFLKKEKKIEEIIEKPISKKISITKITYKTDFDKFYEYIRKNKEVTITQIGKQFKMPKKQVEDWSRILEEHELITIKYPLFGDQLLQFKG